MSDTKNDEWKERELGALWLKEGKSGKFFSGKVGDQEVVVYKNDKYVEGGNFPYYRIYKSKPLVTQEAKPEEKNDGIPF